MTQLPYQTYASFVNKYEKGKKSIWGNCCQATNNSVRGYFIWKKRNTHKRALHSPWLSAYEMLLDHIREEEPKQTAAVSANEAKRNMSSESLRWTNFVRQKSKMESCSEKKLLSQHAVLSIPWLKARLWTLGVRL